MKELLPNNSNKGKIFKSLEANVLNECNKSIDSLGQEVIHEANMVCNTVVRNNDLDNVKKLLLIETKLKPAFKAAFYLSQYQNMSTTKMAKIIAVLELEQRIRNAKDIAYKNLTRKSLQYLLYPNKSHDTVELEELRNELSKEHKIGGFVIDKTMHDAIYNIKEQVFRNSVSDLKALVLAEKEASKIKNPKKAKQLFERSRSLVTVFETMGFQEAAQTASLVEDSFYNVYQHLKQERRNKFFLRLRQILAPIAFASAIAVSGLQIHNYFSNKKHNKQQHSLLVYKPTNSDGFKPSNIKASNRYNRKSGNTSIRLENIIKHKPNYGSAVIPDLIYHTKQPKKNLESTINEIPLTVRLAHIVLSAQLFIYVNKSKDSLYVYDAKHNLKRLFAARCITGLNHNPKKHGGDNATPEGSYRIIYNLSTTSALFGSRAIGLNYPNSYDRSFGRTKSKTILICGSYLPERELAIKNGKDITFGSVVMENSDIEQLNNYINNKEDKTCVIIESQSRRLTKEQIMAWKG